MGLGIKLLNILGGQKTKMKEKKSDSFSFFRKSGSRYSFTSEKKKQQQDGNNVQIRRLSWTSFPSVKVSVPEETPVADDVPSRLSQSSENLKKQARTLNSLSKSKSSSFFKSSSSTVKNIFNASSSSASVSSSNSSTSSSPKIRQSWSSGVTNILEKAAGDANNTLPAREEDEPNPYDIRHSGTEAIFLTKKDAIKPKLGSSFSRNYFPASSLMDEENEAEIMSTPKIICAHKKTPDATRKSRRQIIQELEYIKELGMLPEEIEPIVITNVTVKENLDPNYENFPIPLENMNLNSFIGYKTTEETTIFNNSVCNKNLSNRPFLCSKPDATFSPFLTDDSQGDSFNNKSQSNSSISDSNCSSSSTINCSSSDITLNSSTDCNETTLNNESVFSKTKTSSGDTSCGPTTSIDNNKNSNSLVELYTPNPLDNSSLTSILVEDDSEGDEDSETMTNNSSTFETRLEDDLENFTDRRNSKGLLLEGGGASDEEEIVQLRRKSRPNLHIDIEKARSQKTFSNDRLRRIADDSSDSARSSRSSPRTPRSPAIDIDVLFKQRQKKIEESSKDNLTQVKDLTQRLRLSTQSSPSAVEWLNGINNKMDARQLAGVMSPVILENSEGIFQLRETDGDLTEAQREKNLTKALVWIKDELIKMREQDQNLARQLVQLQLEMQRLRLHRSCTQHEALLEEVTCEEEEQKALMTSTDLIDLPNNIRECAFLSLRDFGVTRMNIANRRFTLR